MKTLADTDALVDLLLSNQFKQKAATNPITFVCGVESENTSYLKVYVLPNFVFLSKFSGRNVKWALTFENDVPVNILQAVLTATITTTVFSQKES